MDDKPVPLRTVEEKVQRIGNAIRAAHRNGYVKDDQYAEMIFDLGELGALAKFTIALRDRLPIPDGTKGY